MPSSFEFIRGFLGILCIFFAHFFGRSVARRLKGQVPQSLAIRWALRTSVTALGAMWGGGLDRLSLVVLSLSVLSGILGFYLEQRPKKKEEDLTHVIFPDDEPKEKA
jgi:hypothetical protein